MAKAGPTQQSIAKHAFASTRKSFKTASGKTGQFYSLPALTKQFP